MPDGQGQVSNFSLDSADRIEVLRGPFSALYGNSSGGVIQIFTADGSETAGIARRDRRRQLRHLPRRPSTRAARNGALDYNVDFSQFYTDGYRGHGRAERENGNAKVDIHLDGDRKLTLLLNTVALPNADDPLGLTRAQFDTDPRQPQPVAVAVRHAQERASGAGRRDLRADARRSTRAFASSATTASATCSSSSRFRSPRSCGPTSPGGVIDLDGNYGGTDARWTYHGDACRPPVRLDRRRQLRPPEPASPRLQQLRRHDARRAGRLAPRRTGRCIQFRPVRAGRLGFRRALVARRRRAPQRGEVLGRTTTTSPRPTATTAATSTIRRHDAGRRPAVSRDRAAGICTRRTATRSKRRRSTNWAIGPTARAGINFNLVPARSRNGEIGSKLLHRQRRRIRRRRCSRPTRVTNSPSQRPAAAARPTRTSIARAGAASKRSSTIRSPNAGASQAAYTYLDATFRSSFLTCPAASTCTTPNTPVAAGSRIPGVPEVGLLRRRCATAARSAGTRRSKPTRRATSRSTT